VLFNVFVTTQMYTKVTYWLSKHMNAKERMMERPMSSTEEVLDRMLTLNEVAYLLHVHPSTVRRWQKKGQLRAYRLGPKSVIRFRKEDVSNFLNLTNGSQDEYGLVRLGK